MSGASSATARSEPIARRCGSEVMPPILPTPGPARHRNTGVDDPVQASAALWLIAGGVDAVLAALALSPDAGDEDPHILVGQLGQPLVAQLGDQVEADHALVSLVRAGVSARA